MQKCKHTKINKSNVSPRVKSDHKRWAYMQYIGICPLCRAELYEYSRNVRCEMCYGRGQRYFSGGAEYEPEYYEVDEGTKCNNCDGEGHIDESRVFAKGEAQAY